MKLIYFLITICFLSLNIFAVGNQWQVVGNMNFPVSGAQAVVLDSSIVVLGGDFDSTGFTFPLNVIQVYYPHTQTWQMTSSLVENRYSFFSGYYADSVIVSCGGIWDPSINIFSIEMWNPATRISEIYNHDINFGRVNFNGHIYNDNLYLLGGLPSPAIRDTVVLPYLVEYNIPSASVTYTFNGAYSPSILPFHQMSAMIGNEIYIFGGTQGSVFDEISVFNVNTKTFQFISNLAGNRGGGKAVTVNNEIYIIGGFSENNYALNTVEILDTGSDSLYFGPSLNYGRSELMAVKFENSIYVFGGKDSSGNAVLPVEKLDLLTGIDKPKDRIVNNFSLKQNYPNPFNSTTNITFELKKNSEISVDIYTVTGQYLKNIIRGSLISGQHKYSWDGKDANGADVSSGVYIYQLTNSYFTISKKMILLR